MSDYNVILVRPTVKKSIDEVMAYESECGKYRFQYAHTWRWADGIINFEDEEHRDSILEDIKEDGYVGELEYLIEQSDGCAVSVIEQYTTEDEDAFTEMLDRMVEDPDVDLFVGPDYSFEFEGITFVCTNCYGYIYDETPCEVYIANIDTLEEELVYEIN